jgi:hypothetical protein
MPDATSMNETAEVTGDQLFEKWVAGCWGTFPGQEMPEAPTIPTAEEPGTVWVII